MPPNNTALGFLENEHKNMVSDKRIKGEEGLYYRDKRKA